ncbi:hypothetical protein NDU88_003648 [Pleurodeles waltl]|uniref:Uncharacterized protein n=1 Tax=Pleurodeles waltl TaxID=8319 RepID=A0AAV7TPA6_PLEWA|nr:hypothetical protein NDU88_003648 [Pleurodeles waltl]
MATACTTKDRTLKEMLSKPTGGKAGDGSTLIKQEQQANRDDSESPVTCTFLEALFTLLREDLQMVSKYLFKDLKEVHCELVELGVRVSTPEDHETGCDKKIEQIQQEVIRLREQQFNLQAHAEDLKERSQRNNMRIRWDQTNTEGVDIVTYVRSLFLQIPEAAPDKEICLDMVHTVGLLHANNSCPTDILVCVHDFQLKEMILHKARDLHPLKLKGQAVVLYQDLSAITLQKRSEFYPVTTHLHDTGIIYSWGHPFRIIFCWEGKLHQH